MRIVLLDVDGVLLDSASAFKKVWTAWAKRHGLDFATVWDATHGRRPVDTIGEVAKHLDAEAEYASLQEAVDHPDLEFPAVDGAYDLLASLPASRWALVTSSDADKVRARFTRVGLPVPSVVVDGAAVTAGKPAPECYRLAATMLGAQPSEAVVIEDSPAGIRAGLNAGMRVIAITTTHAGVSLSDAHAVVSSLAEAQMLVGEWLESEAPTKGRAASRQHRVQGSPTEPFE